MTRVPHAIYVFCLEHTYIYSKHVQIQFNIFHILSVLYSFCWWELLFIYIKYSICILITGTYSMCHKFSIGLFRVGLGLVQGLGFRVGLGLFQGSFRIYLRLVQGLLWVIQCWFRFIQGWFRVYLGLVYGWFRDI